jgi:hypothetical protein
MAFLALDGGEQFLLVDHYEHPDRLLDLRAQASYGQAKEATQRFLTAANFDADAVTWMSND